VVRLEGYEIPVPKCWLVSQTNPVAVELDRVQDMNSHFVSEITILSASKPFAKLDEWKSMVETLRRNRGVAISGQQFSLGLHSRIICIEGEYVRTNLSIDCRSDARLQATFIGRGADIQEFYGIVANMRAIP